MTDAAPHRLLAAVRRLVLASSATPLDRLWRLGYRVAGRLVAMRIAHRYDATVYVRGAASRGRVIPGLSDIDLIAIAPSGAHLPNPPIARSLGGLAQADLYPADELEAILGSTYTTFGLDSLAAAYAGLRVLDDPTGLLDRPGIPAETTYWRRLAGPQRRPPTPVRDRQATVEACWCELIAWWRFALRAINRSGPEPSDAYLCVKLVAEPLRALLALDGRDARDREEALVLGASVAPSLGSEIEAARSLLHNLHRSPEAPLAQTLPVLVALSRLVVARIASELPAGESVRLDGAVPAAEVLPLADWRAVVAEGLPGNGLRAHDADPASLDDIRRISALAISDVHAIHSGDLLLEPSARPWWTGRTRTLQAPFTDPVTFALLAGSATASFPRARGWSAADWARRAVAEWSAWIAAPPGEQPSPPGWHGPPDPAGATAATARHLLGAARAALFSLSLAAGAPVLLLDAERVASETGIAATAVLDQLRDDHDPRPADVDGLRVIVRAHLTAASGLPFHST